MFTNQEELSTKLFHAVQSFTGTENFGSEFQSSGLSKEESRAVKLFEEGFGKLGDGVKVPFTSKENLREILNTQVNTRKNSEQISIKDLWFK